MDLVKVVSQKSFDFLSASQRHYADAAMLQANARLPNASQLFGLSAECGVKALIEKILSQPLPKKFYKHANNLLPDLQILANGRQKAKYLAMIGRFKAFKTWDIDHRYRAETEIPLTEYMADWVDASREVQNMLTQAYLDGVFT